MSEFHRVAYIMSRFPGLSETFILREMCEMERIGWPISLYALIYQEESVIHEEAKSWMKKAQRHSFLSITIANIKLVIIHPWLYFSIFFRIIFENIRSPKFLIRGVAVFPKAVWMASQMLIEEIKQIHSHYATHSALAAWIINRITGIPYGITVHAHDIFVDRSMLRLKLLDAKYIISISEYNLKFITSLYGDWVTSKSHVVHCGIYLDKYEAMSSSYKSSKRFELISIGSLRPYKGFATLLDTCAKLKRDGFSFRCRIIGGGELYNVLLTKAKGLDIGDVVEFMGPKNQAEVANLLRSADCYVQPSIITSTGKMEGIPVSLMEAMASGLPVIASDISGIPELVIHGTTGILVPPGDSDAIVNAILQLYNDRKISSILSTQGRDLVLREFDIIKSVNKLTDIFRDYFEDYSWK